MRVFRTLWLRAALIPFIVIALGAGVAGVLAWNLLHTAAKQEGVTRAEALARANQLGRHWQTGLGGPGLDEKSKRDPKAKPLPGPAVVSQNGRDYELFRLVSLNPKDKIKAPDEYEQLIIDKLNEPNAPKRYAGEIKLISGRCAIVATPIRLQKGCTKCHSSSVGAVGSKSGSSPIKPGDLMGVGVAYVSTDPIHAGANRTFFSLAIIFLLAILVALPLLAFNTNLFVAKPLKRICDGAAAIRRGESARDLRRQPSAETAMLATVVEDFANWCTERVNHEQQLRALFQQFVPAAVAARALGKDADKVISGNRLHVTVMVLNIRNLTYLMDNLPPGATASTLNKFFSHINKQIVDHHGVISSYMGDTVVAVFGTQLGGLDDAHDAVKAAIAIPRALQDLYLDLDEEYGWQLGVGIGIATGEAVVGVFGSAQHREYAVLGDVAMQAYALERLSRNTPEEDTLLMSAATHERVVDEVNVFDLGDKAEWAGKPFRAYLIQGAKMGQGKKAA